MQVVWASGVDGMRQCARVMIPSKMAAFAVEVVCCLAEVARRREMVCSRSGLAMVPREGTRYTGSTWLL